MSDGQGPAGRLFAAAKQLLKSLVGIGETRLRLLVLELEEERARLVSLLLVIGLCLILLLLGLVVLVLLVVVVFWDSHRLLALGACSLALLGAGLGCGLWARRLARRPSLLKGTLRHLATDRELLESGGDAHEPR
ncbi:phage holin family protein [Bisbaumannia pacifica]|uniref:Phage holin family protein n=1 Tax=Bisbaumannia pacifica TaxID=77098 RepID=A0ABD4L0R4_9GAMM|nr:phage holin family protein [Halomonas pacifica]MBH8580168.1 phage holin family protein [Halomonas pacifica]